MIRKRNWMPYLMIAPSVIHLALFALFPIVYVLGTSFFQWNLLRGNHRFFAIENYSLVFSDGSFWNSLKNSLVYAGVGVPIGMLVAFLVAILVCSKLKGVTFFRTLYYFPAVTSQVALAMVWIYVFLPETGLINAMLRFLKLPGATDFLNDVHWAMPALIFMSIWVGLGPRMILFSAGILNISPELYEAAEIDGAGVIRKHLAITLPMLAPTTLFVLITSTIGALQVFTPIYMMTKGGPLDSTDVVGYHIYTTAWRDFQIGEASAQSVVLLVVTALVASLQFRIMKRQTEAIHV